MPILLSESASRHLSTFSLYLLYCTALFYFSNLSLGDATYRLFLYCSLLSLVFSRQGTWGLTALTAIMASVLIQVASWSYSLMHHPEYAEPAPDFKRMTSLLLFVLVAWTLYVNKRQPWLLFLAFFVGTSVTPFTKGEGIEEFLGTRSDFGILNAQHPAMMFSIALVGLVVFAKRIFLMSPLRRNATAILYMLALFYCLAILVVTNTRGIFIGISLAFLLISFAMLKYQFRSGTRKAWFVGILAAIICIPVATSSDHLTSRWVAESSDLKGIAEGNLDAISNRTSVGIRVHSWAEAYHWFLDSPVVGWGANGKKLVISQSDALPGDLRTGFTHLHNSYLEVLVNNGLLGLVFLISIYWWIGQTIFRSAPRQDFDVRIFAMSSCLLWLVANCFESYMFFKSGVITFAIIAGGLTSLGLSSSEQTVRADTAK